VPSLNFSRTIIIASEIDPYIFQDFLPESGIFKPGLNPHCKLHPGRTNGKFRDRT